MEFGFAFLALLVETRCVLVRYPALWNAIPELKVNPISYLPILNDPKLLAGINRTLLSDPAMLLSTVASGVLLATLYHRGRNEQLHLPVLLIACAATGGMHLISAAPIDILAFVYFPWVFLLGLFVSSRWETFVREKQAADMQANAAGKAK